MRLRLSHFGLMNWQASKAAQHSEQTGQITVHHYPGWCIVSQESCGAAALATLAGAGTVCVLSTPLLTADELH